ncbi:hypothetical protein GCM10009096_21360 [Parasphingorhabdus litoris]|uniref:Lipoprotein n=1 Tax=Parasphingorhabdus litoris TaxID=394733 RepID=A0ABN1AKW4_9SPHN|nr:hypothetical protein [Parasphingorhabdus litoris]
MKFYGISAASVLCLAGCTSEPSQEAAVDAETSDAVTDARSDLDADAQSETEGDFDAASIAAAQVCHDHVWYNIEKFKDLPNAAISAFPSSETDGEYVINWNVSWDDPEIKAAGTCLVKDDQVSGFEDYTEK